NKTKQRIITKIQDEIFWVLIIILVILKPVKVTLFALTKLEFLNKPTISPTSPSPHSSTTITTTPPGRTVLSISATNRDRNNASAKWALKAKSNTLSKNGKLCGSARFTSGGESTNSVPVTSTTPIWARPMTSWPAPAEMQMTLESL
ncbi:hypothetical protein PanWU01x14_000030, partial [Parasponia andersonii]